MYLPFIEAISKKFKTPVTILAKKNTKVEMYFNNKEIHIRTNTNLTKPLSVTMTNTIGGFFSGNLFRGCRQPELACRHPLHFDS